MHGAWVPVVGFALWRFASKSDFDACEWIAIEGKFFDSFVQVEAFELLKMRVEIPRFPPWTQLKR